MNDKPKDAMSRKKNYFINRKKQKFGIQKGDKKAIWLLHSEFCEVYSHSKCDIYTWT